MSTIWGLVIGLLIGWVILAQQQSAARIVTSIALVIAFGAIGYFFGRLQTRRANHRQRAAQQG